MPYPNEHAARLRDPGNYVRFRRENDKFGVGVHAVWGIKASGTVELQAIRFDAKKFTVAEAKTWLKDHKYTPILFEPASGKKSDEEEGMESRIVKILPLSVRADLGPRSIDEDARTVELIITTATGIRRRDWMTGKEYVEVLSMDPAHVRLERINNGAPLLDSHNSFSVADQLGVVVPNSVELMKKAMIGKVRFSKREAVEPIWADVKDGVITNVSVGYKVYAYEETVPKDENALPIRKAVNWEPYETSLVPIPADYGAKVRAGESNEANECEIVTREDPPPTTTITVTQVTKVEETPMLPSTRQDGLSDTIVEHGDTPPPAKPAPAEPNERDEGVKAERERIQGIHVACRAARLPVSIEEALIAEGLPLVKAQARVFEELARREDPNRDVPNPNSRHDPGPEFSGGDDPFVHEREGIENALLHRLYPKPSGNEKAPGFVLSEKGRKYRGMGLMDIAEVFLRARGIRVTGMSKMERAGAAFEMYSRHGMHSMSDFPLLLADVANKVLRAAYEAAPQTWVPIAKEVPLTDFKASKQLQVGDAPGLLEVLEHGEFKSGSITEAKEQIQLKTYGRIFAITRQALINDDTNAFAEVPASFGRAARALESDLAWAQITSNPDMGDGKDLFHADHGNLDAVGSVISVESIGQGRASMRVQKAIDGVTLMNLSAAYLIVPAALETIADQYVAANMMAAAPGYINPFAGRLRVIAEPRLDDDDCLAWYMAVDQAQCPVLLHGTLDGQAGPNVSQELGFDVDGLKIKCRLDVAFKAADWRAIYKNVGAS